MTKKISLKQLRSLIRETMEGSMNSGDNTHPVLYPNPTKSQLSIVDKEIDISTLHREFPKLVDILLKNTQMNWEDWDEDERGGHKDPFSYVKATEGTPFIIVPLDSYMAEAHVVEDYVQPIPGHLALFMESGWSNTTLVFLEDGLIG